MSRIGRMPISIPSGLEVTQEGTRLTVKGPLGTPLVLTGAIMRQPFCSNSAKAASTAVSPIDLVNGNINISGSYF